MNCDCPHITDPGDAYTKIDAANGTLTGYVVCPCGKREKVLFVIDYRPELKK